MRFSSSRHSGFFAFLAAVLSIRMAVPCPGLAAGAEYREPALLLKYASPDIPEDASRSVLEPLAGLLSKEIRAAWVSVPQERVPAPDPDASYPVPDDAALRKIAGKISEASSHMERVENDAARKALAEAGKAARALRFTEATRPFLAEIFLREGMLALREGDIPAAEGLFARSRALRPGFSPDPALFPPQVLAAWDVAARRPSPEADLLIESLPSGAEIAVDGERMGRTPSRIRPGKTGPVRIRVSHRGYMDVERIGQWLPGDSETLDFTLPGDRVARLGELLSEDAGKRGKSAGPLFDEFASAAGARRIVVLAMEKDGSGEGFRVRAYSRGIPGGDPVFLGEMPVSRADDGPATAAHWFAGRLLDNGWPAEAASPEAVPWYKKWWVWGILLSGAGIAALLAGGGGGSGGSGDSSVAVNF